uniref:Uncharacterized protein n=1 Tax=Ananas comosus var. bracteatus TaxID=296719 RepID=A0A6V7P1J2_ANACO|nr:unnamed protein product [Ananas comosus var. bracteatus]
MHLQHLNTTTNTTSLFLSFFLDDLLSFCTFLASHPLPFAYLLFFSPHILSLLSFLSPSSSPPPFSSSPSQHLLLMHLMMESPLCTLLSSSEKLARSLFNSSRRSKPLATTIPSTRSG